MSSRYQTQCPRCHTIYPMPESKLGEEKARANCGKCQHTFFLNSHLVNVGKPKPEPVPTPAIPDDEIIFDDVDDDKASSDQATTDINFDGDGLDEFIKQEFENTTPKPRNTADEDESWLDELLKDDDNSIPKTIVSQRPSDDISDVIGVDIKSYIPEAPVKESTEEILKKVNERLQHAPTQEQILTKRSGLLNVVWAVGCVILLGMLGMQYAFFHQNTLNQQPDKAFLKPLCPFCNFAESNPSAFEASYQIAHGTAEHTTNMIGTLKNTSGQNQLYPNLKIRIMGKQGLIGDLALAPSEYLAGEQTLLLANQSGRFMLTLDVATEDITTITFEPFY